MSVRFLNWWPGFEPESSFMMALLRAATRESLLVVNDLRAQVDLEVHSVFTHSESMTHQARNYLRSRRDITAALARRRSRDYGVGAKGPAERHIWYTGENLRPPANWDLTLSFDSDEFDGSNYYLPHWAIRTGALGVRQGGDMMSVGQDTYLSHREVDRVPRKFACVLASNPHPMRDHILEALAELGPVDTYGRAFGKPIASKAKLLQDYRFCITPENDLYPGYVTEKPFEAWLSQTLPIWWGSDPHNYLNQSTLVNIAEGSLANMVERVATLEASPAEWLHAMTQPLMEQPYDYDALVAFVAKRIN